MTPLLQKESAGSTFNCLIGISSFLEIDLHWLETGEIEPVSKTVIPAARLANTETLSGPEAPPSKVATFRGRAAAGVWCKYDEMSEFNCPELVPYVPSQYSSLEQFAFLVIGKTMERDLIFDGDFVICVKYSDARQTPTVGDIVVVERRTPGFFEIACKRLKVSNGQLVTISRTNDPPLPSGNPLGESELGTVEILGLAIAKYRRL